MSSAHRQSVAGFLRNWVFQHGDPSTNGGNLAVAVKVVPGIAKRSEAGVPPTSSTVVLETAGLARTELQCVIAVSRVPS